MCWEILYFIRIDFVEVFLTGPQLNFHYGKFSFIKPLSEGILNIVVYGLLLSAVLITIGKWYRIAIGYFCVAFTYLFLIDKAYYNNHLYLICLISLLLFFIPADKRFSLNKDHKDKSVPAWSLYVLRFQVLIVYFYGGIAKINTDWLVNKQPAIAFIEQKASNSKLSDILLSDSFIQIIVHGGMLFDLAIAPLILYKKTRTYALIAAIIFNVTNAWLFNDINIFPYFMLFALILFIDPELVAKKFNQIKKGKEKSDDLIQINKQHKKIASIITFYFLIQLIVPLRSILKSNIEWTEQGQRFSWRMKIQHRTIEAVEFKILDFDTKTIIPVNMASFGLNLDQMRLLSLSPSAAIQFAKFVKEWAIKKKGLKNIEVRANIIVGLNGREAQQMFKEVDLSKMDVYENDVDEYLQPLNP